MKVEVRVISKVHPDGADEELKVLLVEI